MPKLKAPPFRYAEVVMSCGFDTLQEQSKKLRRSVYEVDESMRENFPAKNTEDSLEKELRYCKGLIDAIKKNITICSYPKVQEKLNLLEESVSDNLEHLDTLKDEAAKPGHKTADTSFFGYKTHIAMTEERIMTAATITSGEKTDGKELPGEGVVPNLTHSCPGRRLMLKSVSVLNGLKRFCCFLRLRNAHFYI